MPAGRPDLSSRQRRQQRLAPRRQVLTDAFIIMPTVK